jgi:hypothetical protein
MWKTRADTQNKSGNTVDKPVDKYIFAVEKRKKTDMEGK